MAMKDTDNGIAGFAKSVLSQMLAHRSSKLKLIDFDFEPGICYVTDLVLARVRIRVPVEAHDAGQSRISIAIQVRISSVRDK